MSAVNATEVARQLADIATEHGVPNGASLDEIAGSRNRLAVARILRHELDAVNAELAGRGLLAGYDRAEVNHPARIWVDCIGGQP